MYIPTTITHFFPYNKCRLEDERNKKKFINAYNFNKKLLHIALNQDMLNLKRKMDFLRIKLNNVKTVLKKDDVKESSKCWSEMLLETKNFMDFLLESFHHISIYIYT